MSRDFAIGKRPVLRLTRTPEKKIHRPVTLLRAHADGTSVLKVEIEHAPYRKITLICGLLVNTRWGAVMVQWRGFGS